MPTITPGKSCLVKNLFISIDPTHRIWVCSVPTLRPLPSCAHPQSCAHPSPTLRRRQMSDKPQYMDPVDLGDVMRAVTVGVVQESDLPDWPVGCHVVGFGGCADFFEGIPGANVLYRAGECSGLPLTADLSCCSVIIGITAWHGVNKVLQVGPGDTVVVSGAAGAVGSLVGQLALLKGARVAGIAGGASKCAWLKDLGFHAAVDYKSQDVAKELAAFAPGGVTCYFDKCGASSAPCARAQHPQASEVAAVDSRCEAGLPRSVGGAVTDAVLTTMKNNGRFALCGSISECACPPLRGAAPPWRQHVFLRR